MKEKKDNIEDFLKASIKSMDNLLFSIEKYEKECSSILEEQFEKKNYSFFFNNYNKEIFLIEIEMNIIYMINILVRSKSIIDLFFRIEFQEKEKIDEIKKNENFLLFLKKHLELEKKMKNIYYIKYNRKKNFIPEKILFFKKKDFEDMENLILKIKNKYNI